MVKAIFCISPGRSGSHYLSGLLEESLNCDSHHEVQPNGFGSALQAFHQGDATEMQEVARAIATAIEAAAARGKVYADTSHCFVKGFGWPLMDLVEPGDIGVVVLTRDKQAVINSTFRAQSGPMKNLGRRFILTPDRQDPITKPPGFLGFGPRSGYALARGLHYIAMKSRRARRKLGLNAPDTQLFETYQRAAIDWYWEETYALGRAFREAYPGCKYFDTGTEDLNSPEVVQDLFTFFGVEPNQALLDKIGVATNLKPGMTS